MKGLMTILVMAIIAMVWATPGAVFPYNLKRRQPFDLQKNLAEIDALQNRENYFGQVMMESGEEEDMLSKLLFTRQTRKLYPPGEKIREGKVLKRSIYLKRGGGRRRKHRRRSKEKNSREHRRHGSKEKRRRSKEKKYRRHKMRKHKKSKEKRIRGGGKTRADDPWTFKTPALETTRQTFSSFYQTTVFLQTTVITDNPMFVTNPFSVTSPMVTKEYPEGTPFPHLINRTDDPFLYISRFN
ncbi:hypothetical protein SK128_000930 [Halocaridina rubra]|uniref:Uncharacterized protein n=1 Tax=Halocaridina rubra TaxID=373956 RepID=A0AAN8WPU3_HALRR